MAAMREGDFLNTGLMTHSSVVQIGTDNRETKLIHMVRSMPPMFMTVLFGLLLNLVLGLGEPHGGPVVSKLDGGPRIAAIGR
jgi:hypothetical protein